MLDESMFVEDKETNGNEEGNIHNNNYKTYSKIFIIIYVIIHHDCIFAVKFLAYNIVVLRCRETFATVHTSHLINKLFNLSMYVESLYFTVSTLYQKYPLKV